jgi:hypothetical protein
MPRTREFIPADEAVSILEVCGYTVRRYGGGQYGVDDPLAVGGEMMYTLKQLRSLARCVRACWESSQQFHHAVLTGDHPICTIFP